MVRLINDFHRTSMVSRKIKGRDDLDELALDVCAGTATPAQYAMYRRIRRTLCPSTAMGCACGGTCHVDRIETD